MNIKGFNEYTILEEITYLSLTDINGIHKDYTIIDTEDLERVKHFRWYKISNGYAITHINNYQFLLHHFILNFIYDFRIDLEVDHRNKNRLDNRKCNLRIVGHSTNMHNAKLSNNNTSGYKGIHYDKASGKWFAYLNIGKKRKHLGRFIDKEEAIKARKIAEEKYLGTVLP